jgi:hypothetical protein
LGRDLVLLERIGAILTHSAAMVNTSNAQKRASMGKIATMISESAKSF